MSTPDVMKEDAAPAPEKGGPAADRSNDHPGGPSGWKKHRWKLVVGALAVAGFWWRRSRRRRIKVDDVSEDWLAQQELRTGKDGHVD